MKVKFDLGRPKEWPLVSISLLVYNQVHLVGRAIEGVLMQQVNFKYEIVAGDDCSNDGTQEVLLEYARKYPDIIVLTLHPKRYDGVPGKINNITNLMGCRGVYTAMLDGDDYWSDPHKLQRQVDKLASNPSLAACAHDSLYEYDGAMDAATNKPKTLNSKIGGRPTGVYTQQDAMPPQNILLKPSSFMFRTRIYGALPDWFYETVMGDVHHVYLVLEQGDLWYDERCMSVQYENVGSFTNTFLHKEWILRRRIWEIDLTAKRFPHLTNNPHYKNQRALQWKRLAELKRHDGKYRDMVLYYAKAVRDNPDLLIANVKNKLLKLGRSID